MLLQYGCAILRAIEQRDAELLLNMMNDEYIDRNSVGLHLPMSLEQEIEWIKNYKNNSDTIRLMIELSNKETLGLVLLKNINLRHRTADFGIKIFASVQNRIKNDTYDACIALFRFAFFELGLNCITSKILETNTPSIKLHEKLGFQKEGMLRERIFTDGKFHNLESRSLLKRDFRYE